MGSIPPVGGGHQADQGMGVPPPNRTASTLWNYVENLRTDMKAFENGNKGILQIEDDIHQMKSFLENNKQEIKTKMESQGASEHTFNTFFNSTIHAIDFFMQDPNEASLDSINEWATQVHFLMTHPSSNIDQDETDQNF